MDKFEQEFIIKARKPIMDGNNVLYGLHLVVTTSIETRKPLDLNEKLWGLFIDKDYRPNELSPLLFVEMPDSQLILLNKEETKNIKRDMKFYKDIQIDDKEQLEMQEFITDNDLVRIQQDEFYKILNNDLHFIHEENLPCKSYMNKP